MDLNIKSERNSFVPDKMMLLEYWHEIKEKKL